MKVRLKLPYDAFFPISGDVEVQIKVGKDTVSPQRKEIFVNPELDIEDPELKKDIGKMSDFKCITELQNDDFKVRVYKKNYKKYDHLDC